MNISRTLIFSSLFVLACAADCQKKTTCSGYVYDSATQERIGSALITVTQSKDEGKTAISDSNGEFQLNSSSMNGKGVIVSVSKNGYVTQSGFPCNINMHIGLEQ